MYKLDEALLIYNKKDYQQAYKLFKEYRNELEDKEQFDKIHSYHFMKTIYEYKIKGLKAIDKETQEDIIYIVKRMTPKDFYYKETVLTVADILSEGIDANWYNVLVWLKKIKPQYLSSENKTIEINFQLIKTHSQIEKYYLKLTKAYEQIKDYDNLYTSCKEALRTLPNPDSQLNVWIKRRLAMCYNHQNNYQEAIKLYKEILLKESKWWYIYEELGNLYEKINDRKNATLVYFDAFYKSNNSSSVINFVRYFSLFTKEKYLKRKLFILYLCLARDKKINLKSEDEELKIKINIMEEELKIIDTKKYFKELKTEIKNLKIIYEK